MHRYDADTWIIYVHRFLEDSQDLGKGAIMMKIGFIGAGRVGCSIGKYLKESGISVTGYFDTVKESASSAAAFTDSSVFANPAELVAASSLLFLTTPDSMILPAWEEIRSFPLAGKIICHCSGALPSDAFSGIGDTNASGCSLHPMLPFSDRYTSYEQLKHAFFTIEGQEAAVQAVSELFTGLGNTVCRIQGSYKPKYHAAASILSNQVVAVLDTGYRLLEECGFSREDARTATKELVIQNIENILLQDCVAALTGPIERNDIRTVQKHLDCLPPEDQKMYQTLGLKLVHLARKKHPSQDYSSLYQLLKDH